MLSHCTALVIVRASSMDGRHACSQQATLDRYTSIFFRGMICRMGMRERVGE
jgi:hypothetical protein